MSTVGRRLAVVAAFMATSPISGASAPTSAFASGTCTTAVQYVNVEVAANGNGGLGTLGYTFNFSSSDKILGGDIHQNSGALMEGYLVHYYTTNGYAVSDTIQIDDAHNDNNSYTAWASVRYCD